MIYQIKYTALLRIIKFLVLNVKKNRFFYCSKTLSLKIFQERPI
jgi:hypothetical protein